MRNGNAPGRRSIRNICVSVAASERIRLIRSSSAERNPTMVFDHERKESNERRIHHLRRNPRPNQITTSGASATFGKDWNMMMKG